ncbi:MAG: hypothetical protein QF864_11470 [SAR202 cluster bacterium]|jgi:hypothetical protein|nr:hypothetical protein [SAR202 cluster bacterium]|tara:strand:- start:4336 stop:4506 length:171 start_codon:yes stop_codon:yes gene_type:complete
MFNEISRYADMVNPYVVKERDGFSFISNPEDFERAIESLKNHVDSRVSKIELYFDN